MDTDASAYVSASRFGTGSWIEVRRQAAVSTKASSMPIPVK